MAAAVGRLGPGGPTLVPSGHEPEENHERSGACPSTNRTHPQAHHGGAGRPNELISRRGTRDTNQAARWVVEQTLALMHQFRRPATRWERRTDIHHGLLGLATNLIRRRRSWCRTVTPEGESVSLNPGSARIRGRPEAER